MKTLTTLLLLTLVASAAIAGSEGPSPQLPHSVPEPGVLGLFATAGVMLFLAKKFRK